jgi:predicted naringenin-chalcone synthase
MLLDGLEKLYSNIFLSGFTLLMILCYSYYIANKRREFQRRTVFINGLASAFPQAQYVQTLMKEMFLQNYCGGRQNVLAKDLDFIDRVFEKTLIDKCHINLPQTRLFDQMNREDYTTYIKDTLLTLACQAANDALLKAHLIPSQITHLVFGTMTGSIRAPSLDIHIIRQLQLNSTVKRLNVEAMGCLTGFRLTGLCHDIAIENERNIVLLVVCDIRSALGNQLTRFATKQPIDKSNVIVSAMFRDAGGAAIFSQQAWSAADLRLVEHRSVLIPNSIDQAVLQEFNHGAIHLFLHKELPESVFAYIPTFINTFLAEHNIDITRCLFALHTGGPRVIRGIQQCLNLQPEQLFGTWYVMRNYGNLSGSSNLVVLEHIMRHQQLATLDKVQGVCFPSDFSKYLYVVGLAFGPGLGIECVIFHL